MYPCLRALGEFGEGELAQVEVFLWVKDSALQQLLPDIPCSGEVRVKQQQSAGDIR